MNLTRRSFLKLMAGGATVLGTSAVYSYGLEPRWLEVSEKTIPLPQSGAVPIRLLHLSDFHASSVFPIASVEAALAKGIALKPDVICATGDYFTHRLKPSWDYVRVLRRLSQAAPVIACLGNHDGGTSSVIHHGGYPTTRECRDLLAASGITCLVNNVAELTIRGRDIQFVGVGDFWSGECFPEIAFGALTGAPRHVRVVLNHNPDAKLLFRHHDWDLMLCGHTHGGQVRIPFVGTPYAPVVDKRYVEGLHQWENRWLHISRGIGNLYGIRINCRPEITVLNLV